MVVTEAITLTMMPSITMVIIMHRPPIMVLEDIGEMMVIITEMI